MTAKPTPEDLARLLFEHPNAVEAHVVEDAQDYTIVACYDPDHKADHRYLPTAHAGVLVTWHPSPPITSLPLELPSTYARNAFNECQNEPIELGTQIQPFARAWVGTAGSPVHWRAAGGAHRYGFLTNWHVLPGGDLVEGHTVHQPDTAHYITGYLANWTEVDQHEVNLVDAAIADTFVDGFHTTAPSILTRGPLNPEPLAATPGLAVLKVGRTTGRTLGTCRETGAAVRVDYGRFTAVFQDQDLFAGSGREFSAAGDSGSLIFCQAESRPVALLFAGGGGITVGNPIRHVIDALPIDFVYP